MNHAISISNLNVAYDDKIVLEAINLEVSAGKITGIVGPNGAGKTTLLKTILGLLEPNTGQLFLLGAKIKAVRKKIAYVPQKDMVDWQFPTTVKEVIMMGRFPHKKLFQRMSETDHQIANKALESLGMQDFSNRQIGELSGGQQQRVFIARALAQEAEILMLDEPFVGVDAKTEQIIVDILKKISKEGKTVLIIHHDLSKVAEYFDDVILLNKKIIAKGSVKEIFNKENLSLTYGGSVTIL